MSEKTETPDDLKRALSLAKIFSLIALPLVVAGGGWFVQSSTNKNTVRSEYVKIAVSVLAEDPSVGNSTLREWAVRHLAKDADPPFTDEQKKALISGEIQLPDYSALQFNYHNEELNIRGLGRGMS